MQDVRLSHLLPAPCAGFFFVEAGYSGWPETASQYLKAVDNFVDNSAPR
jgi:hypothetical protein